MFSVIQNFLTIMNSKREAIDMDTNRGITTIINEGIESLPPSLYPFVFGIPEQLIKD